MSTRPPLVLSVVVALLPLGAGSLPARAAEGLEWSVTPNIWATETTVDLKADGTAIGGGTISFGDLLDVTDASFQVHVEAGRKHFSGFTDLTYLETSDSLTGPLATIDSESEQWFIDAAFAYWPWGEETGLSFFGGVRYTRLDDTYDFSLAGQPVGSLTFDRDFTDLLLGVRYQHRFNKRWAIHSRLDGSFGDSEGTFLVESFGRVAVGRHGFMFGYRYKEAKFDESRVQEDYKYKGPVGAFNFRF